METNRRILVLDDETETIEGYKYFLTPSENKVTKRSSRHNTKDQTDTNNIISESYTLLTATTGEEALEIFKKEFNGGRRIAAGFFDVKLPGKLDGLQTIQKIIEIDPEIHVVVVTAYHDRSVDEIHKLFGENFKDQWDYLNKPFTQGEIIQKARQMVAAWNNKRKLEAMHAQLIRSERMAAIGQVSRGVGHEFGNILLRIVGKADLSLMESDTSKIHENLEIILKASERASVIVRNLQSFSKTQANYETVPITNPIEQALSLLNHELIKNSIKVNKVFSDTPNIWIDSGGISQVILNMLINAMHAMPKGGEISIHTETNTGRNGKPGVACRIKDGGVGIPKEIINNIFEFAFTTKGDKGSGLGLSISKQIIENMNGSISVKSELNKGTEFTVWIPLNNG